MRIQCIRIFVIETPLQFQRCFGMVFSVIFLVYFASIPSVVPLCRYPSQC